MIGFILGMTVVAIAALLGMTKRWHWHLLAWGLVVSTTIGVLQVIEEASRMG